MDTGNIITAGIVVIGFVANAAYLKGVFGTRIQQNCEDITALQSTVVYKDTCIAHREGLENRVGRLEHVANGALKYDNR